MEASVEVAKLVGLLNQLKAAENTQHSSVQALVCGQLEWVADDHKYMQAGCCIVCLQEFGWYYGTSGSQLGPVLVLNCFCY